MKYGVETGVAIKARSHPLASLSLSLPRDLVFMYTRTKPVRMAGNRYFAMYAKGREYTGGVEKNYTFIVDK